MGLLSEINPGLIKSLCPGTLHKGLRYISEISEIKKVKKISLNKRLVEKVEGAKLKLNIFNFLYFEIETFFLKKTENESEFSRIEL